MTIDSQLLASLLLFTLVGAVSPGGATVLATASGAQFGYRKSLPLMLGIALGLATVMGFAASGLGALIRSTPSLQTAMKVLGTAYFLWLAWQIAKAPPLTNRSSASERPIPFHTGILLLWLNPKAWAMAMGASAAYAGMTPSPFQTAAIIALSFCGIGFLSLSAWCLGGTLLVKMIRKDRHWRIVQVSLALMLVATIVPMWL